MKAENPKQVIPPPECLLKRSDGMPSFANYDGMVSRLCDFLGCQTGSTRGNYEAVKGLLNSQIRECAAAHGTSVVNGPAVHGKGRLVFERLDLFS